MKRPRLERSGSAARRPRSGATGDRRAERTQKRAYYLLHVAAIALYLLLTYLAFAMLIPFYLMVVFGGFALWQALVERHATRRIPRAVLVAALQAIAFLWLVFVEFKLLGLPLGAEQIRLTASLGGYAGAGFLVISIATTLLSQRNAKGA